MEILKNFLSQNLQEKSCKIHSAFRFDKKNFCIDISSNLGEQQGEKAEHFKPVKTFLESDLHQNQIFF